METDSNNTVYNNLLLKIRKKITVSSTLWLFVGYFASILKKASIIRVDYTTLHAAGSSRL